jgi:hypothetical protein
VTFIHERIGTDAIAEEYIEGREIYVGVLGNERRRVLPVWELDFGKVPAGAPRIATERVKHDPSYQERRGILQGPAEGLAPEAKANPECREADLPHAGDRRLRARRLPPARRRHRVLHRGESQSGDRPDRGVRAGRGARRHQLSGPAEPDPGAGHGARARECRLGRRRRRPVQRAKSSAFGTKRVSGSSG